MLKRNGNNCQHSVPDYSGRLTDGEFLAYNGVFNSIEDDFKEFASVTDAVIGIENSLPRLLDSFSLPTESAPQLIESPDGSQWQVATPLLRVRGSEVLACKRQVEQRIEYAIVERFDPNSPLAKAQGACDVQMTSHDPRTLLNDFMERQRETLKLYADDIVGIAQERAEEKYPGQDLGRVIKAISQRCTKRISGSQTVAPAQGRKQNEGMRV
jgi:hypothetical protein